MSKLQQVWVIDDDPINNIVFRKLSDFTGFTEELADFVNAVDALDQLQQLVSAGKPLPDAIFLDVSMPIVSGWDFLNQLKTTFSSCLDSVTIYMLTSSSNQSDIHRAAHHGCVNDYIVKPITVDKLNEIKERHQVHQNQP
jgi:CheY-like chemotaxis protein